MSGTPGKTVLAWRDDSTKNQAGRIVSPNRRAELPHIGLVSVHTHIHYPGMLLLTCHRLFVDKRPLKAADMDEALPEAEQVLRKTLSHYIETCQAGLDALSDPGRKEEKGD